MPDEQAGQQQQGGGQDQQQSGAPPQPKSGSIGKQAAEELSGKIHNDEQQKLDHETDENYDAQFQQHLVEKLKPEVTAFNDKAEFADALKMTVETDMLKFFRDNQPSYALIIRKRELHFLDPGSSTPVSSLLIKGGPDEYVFLGGAGSAAPIDEADAIKGFIRLAAGGKFQAE